MKNAHCIVMGSIFYKIPLLSCNFMLGILVSSKKLYYTPWWTIGSACSHQTFDRLN